MKNKINSKRMYYKLKPQVLYYMYKSGYIVGYKKIHADHKVIIIEFYDLTRIWVLAHESQYFTKITK